MSDTRWDIYLLGEPQPGIERSTLVRNLATLFKKDVPVIEKMLRKPRNLLKADVDLATAKKYKTAISKAGGRCELAEHGEQLFPTDALSPVVSRPSLSLAPIGETPAASAPAEQTLAVSPSDSLQVEGRHSDSDYFCFKCGALLHSGINHCPKCFARQPQVASKNKILAGFLAFFFGSFGVHRFYLGQWWGIFYLIFALTLIPGFIALLEALAFWFSSNERWQRKYGQVPATDAGMMAGVIVGGLFVMFMLSGIIAAIALPAYQDYTMRAKVNAAMPLINETRAKVEKVIAEKNFFPSENIMAGLPETLNSQYVESIRLGKGAQLIVSFKLSGFAKNFQTLVWTPRQSGKQLVWDCKQGSMPDKYRPSECRGGTGANASLDHPQSGATATNTRLYSDDKTISLVIPGNWKGNRQLNENALLGIANVADVSFAIVLSESKQSFNNLAGAADYLASVKDNLRSADAGLRELQPVETLQINGRLAKQQVVTFSSGGTSIVYLLTVVETDSDFYIVYAWTLDERYQKNQVALRKISNSFTVYPQASTNP